MSPAAVARITASAGRPDDARNPALVELAFLASRAQQAAQSEVPAGDAGLFGLEGGGGAPTQRAAGLSDEEIGNRIVARHNGGSSGLAW